MEIIKKLKEGNKVFVDEMLTEDSEFFVKLAEGQTPQVLWIGCSDSRAPANEITNTTAGDIFVHRNIANMVVHTDMNLLSVLDYAVNVLKVKHVIVCGHYQCGGIKAAMDKSGNGFVFNWIRHIKDVYRLYEKELEAITDFQERFDKFVEINVYEQVFDLVKTSIVQNAWVESNFPLVHGWVFDVRTGIIKDLNITFDSQTPLPDIYKIDSDIVKN